MSKYKWNLKLLLRDSSNSAIQKDLDGVKTSSYKFINKWKNSKKYLSDPLVLKQALDEYEKWLATTGTTGNAGYYIYLKHSQDQTDTNIRAELNRAEEQERDIKNAIRFFEHNLAKVPKKKQKEFIGSKHLADYKHFLEKLFANADHLLTDPQEHILTLTEPTSQSNWVRMTQSLLTKEESKILMPNGKKAVKTFSEILALINDKNKKTRDSAAICFNEILEQYKYVAENEINSVLMYKKNIDKLRKYSLADSARHLSDDIDPKVIKTMTQVVSKNFKIAKNYYVLKAKLFGVKKLAYHERNLEYGKLDKKYSFENGVRIIRSVTQKLDSDFLTLFDAFINEGRIDVYPTKSKSSGAFCISILKSQPVYILLNWTDQLRDVTTLAHELGHGINDELSKVQNSLYYGTSLATAEVASTFMEDFVVEKLMEETDDELKHSLMMSKLDSDISSIFRQVAFYNFETELHKEFRKAGYLSHSQIGKLFTKHMKSYMGSAVEQSTGSENWWIYVGHFRRFFYVYSYASGLLISKYLQSQVRKDPMFINQVKNFLATGVSDSPKNIFNNVGVDITDANFWQRGINEVSNLLKETEQLAKNLGKIKS